MWKGLHGSPLAPRQKEEEMEKLDGIGIVFAGKYGCVGCYHAGPTLDKIT